jgi:hypothetical protein
VLRALGAFAKSIRHVAGDAAPRVTAGPQGSVGFMASSIWQRKRRKSPKTTGGAEGNRTPDLLNAIQALSQLSYGPDR